MQLELINMCKYQITGLSHLTTRLMIIVLTLPHTDREILQKVDERKWKEIIFIYNNSLIAMK